MPCKFTMSADSEHCSGKAKLKNTNKYSNDETEDTVVGYNFKYQILTRKV